MCVEFHAILGGVNYANVSNGTVFRYRLRRSKPLSPFADCFVHEWKLRLGNLIPFASSQLLRNVIIQIIVLIKHAT